MDKEGKENEVKKNILIIEDEENIARAQGLILGNRYNIFYAYDGEEGLRKAKEIKPDLIILDLMLPNRGGYDVCFNIRQNEYIKNTKILMVTAKNLRIDEDKGVFVGADGYLTKPFEPEDLIEQVQKLL